MAKAYSVRSVKTGFCYTLFEGCDTDSNGVVKGTASRIRGGWAATETEAKKRVTNMIAE